MSAVTGGSPFTPRQENLLQAVFRVDAEGVSAWHRWRAGVDWESHLPHEEFRLLPELYRNLRKLEIKDPLLGRFKGVLRQSWAANQGLIQKIIALLRLLNPEPGAAVLLAPTSLLVLDDTAIVSPMAPVRVGLRAECVAAAITALLNDGWKPTWIRLPNWSLHGFVAAADALQLHHPDGTSLDLRWSPARQSADSAIPIAWAQARPHAIGNDAIWLPDSTGALGEMCSRPPVNSALAAAGDLLLCARGIARSKSADAVPATTAWVAIGSRLRGLLPDTFGVAMVDAAELMAMRASDQTPNAAVLPLHQRFAAHWRDYRAALGSRAAGRASGRALGFTSLCQLPGYLQGLWGLSSPARIPLRFLRGIGYEWRLPLRSPQTAAGKDL